MTTSAERVAALEEDMRRAGALLLEGANAAELVARMLRNLFMLAGVEEGSKRGPHWATIEAELRGDDDEDGDDVGWRPSLAAPDPSSRFYAWDLAEWAVAAAAEERGHWVDASLDAFEAIIESPRDPGNDGGPMCAMAAVMDAAQLRRAWGIAGRMREAGWFEPSQTTAYLVRRAAALGEPALARTWLLSIADPEVRALALGFAAAWSEPLVASGDLALLAGSGLTEFVRGLVWALDHPSEMHVATCLRLLDGHADAEARDRALILLEPWYPSGPVQGWLDAIATAGESCRVFTSWGLANAREAELRESLVELAVGYTVAQRQPDPVRWLGEESELLVSLSVPAARRAFARLLCVPGVGRRWPLPDLAGSELRRLVVHLGGETAPGVVLRVLTELDRGSSRMIPV